MNIRNKIQGKGKARKSNMNLQVKVRTLEISLHTITGLHVFFLWLESTGKMSHSCSKRGYWLSLLAGPRQDYWCASFGDRNLIHCWKYRQMQRTWFITQSTTQGLVLIKKWARMWLRVKGPTPIANPCHSISLVVHMGEWEHKKDTWTWFASMIGF